MSIRDNLFAPDRELLVKYRGVFDPEGLYKTMYNWFKSRKFEWHEKMYKDKHPVMGDEQEINIEAFRNDTEFIRVWINIYMHTYDLEKVEVIKDGKKKILEKGRVLITIGAEFEFDYENNWENSKFQEALRTFLIKYLLLRKIQVYGDKIEYEVHNLQEVIKKYLDMQAKGNQFADMW